MMKKFIVLLVSIAIVSCGKKESSENNTKEKKDTMTQIRKETIEKGNISGASDTNKTKPTDLKWEFKKLGEGKYGEPVTQVYLILNGSKMEIEKIEFGFSELNRNDYEDYHIPKNALTACQGWWAGAGIDYWVIKSSGGYEVYRREIGESTTESGEPSDYQGEPKKIKTISAE